MARAKPKWRRVLNTRFLRWWVLRQAVRAVPGLGRHLGFFPDHVDMIAGADRVLADQARPVTGLTMHMAFLTRCQAHDSRAPEAVLPDGVITGRRTALYDNAWIDMTTASVLLPGAGQTVLVRGQRANWNATSARLGRDRVEMPGRVFAPLNTRNYFHVLLENGVRLLDLLESGLVADASLHVIVGPDITAVERAMLDGIAALHPTMHLHTVPRGALVVPDQAVVHFPPDTYWEWPPLDRKAVDRLAEAFAQVYGAPDGGTDALYLSRRGAKLRAPSNEAALEAALQGAGFSSFVASDANHPDQIARFRSARRIVAVHGAGLTNLIFAQPGAEVVEIFPSDFVKSTYWRLAQVLGLRYRPVIAGPGDYDQRFEVDIDAVLTALED